MTADDTVDPDDPSLTDDDGEIWQMDTDAFQRAAEVAPERVIIKTYEGIFENYEDGLEALLMEEIGDWWANLTNDYPDLTIRRSFRTVFGPSDVFLPELLTYYEILLPPDKERAMAVGRSAVDALSGLGVIEVVYIESPPAPSPDRCDGRNRFYLGGPPRGMAIDPVQEQNLDDWPLVVVMEKVWAGEHPDLAHVKTATRFPPEAEYGDRDNDGRDDFAADNQHSVASLGILGATGGADGPGCPGMLPPQSDSQLFVASPLVNEGNGRWVMSINSQIVALAQWMSTGAILLVELQIEGRLADSCDAGSEPDSDDRVWAPLELEPHLRSALAEARARQITVIEPAGNGGTSGGVELSELVTWNQCLSMPDTSVAILTAACDTIRSSGIHDRLPESNFGAQVVCYSWGNSVVALDSANLAGTWTFGGTSSASALVAGVAARLQRAARQSFGRFLSPDEMHTALRFSPTVPPLGDGLNIGVMPNLDDIVTHHLPTL